MQVVISTTLSRLIPLQLVFARFQYVSKAKFSLLRQKWAIQCEALIIMSFNVRPWLGEWLNFWLSKPFGSDIAGLICNTTIVAIGRKARFHHTLPFMTNQNVTVRLDYTSSLGRPVFIKRFCSIAPFSLSTHLFRPPSLIKQTHIVFLDGSGTIYSTTI